LHTVNDSPQEPELPQGQAPQTGLPRVELATEQHGAVGHETAADPPVSTATAEPFEADSDPALAALGRKTVPIFYDAERRRWPWFVRLTGAALFFALLGIALLVVSLFALPLMPRNKLPRPITVHDVGNLDPVAAQHTIQIDLQTRRIGVHLANDKQRLSQFNTGRHRLTELRRQKEVSFLSQVASGGVSGGMAGLLHEMDGYHASSVPANAPPVVAGFYVNWEQSSRASAERNIGALTHFIPEWLSLKKAATDFTDLKTPPFLDERTEDDRKALTQLVRSHSVPILPLLNNFIQGKDANGGNFDPEPVHELLSHPLARANLIVQLRDWLLKNQMQGINIDFEEVRSEDGANLVLFMKELYAALHPHGLLVTQDVQVDNDSYNLTQLAKWNDWLVPMFYDEHARGTSAGPVAGIDWVRSNLQSMLSDIPPGKIVMGIGNQGYNWANPDDPHSDQPDTLGYEDSVMTARESQPDAVIHLDSKSLNPTFTYTEDAVDTGEGHHEEPHAVWMLDAVTAYNQLQVARPHHLRGAALWVLGQEDPSIWTFYNRAKWKSDWGSIIDGGGLSRISFAGTGLINFDGEGELLQPIAEPTVGRRQVTRDPKTGLIVAESYLKDAEGHLLVPTSYVVRRFSGVMGEASTKGKILLSFDDGPDPVWTPQILDILREYKVPAVFFVVGKNAENYPDLVRREWDDGFEIGNHTWDHPELDDLLPAHQRVELTSTQRIIQAITGHSTTLFRPPYGNDVEPQTGKEVRPLDLAATLGYITVGQKNDPQDWRLVEYKPGTEILDPSRPRTAESIVQSVIANRDEGSIVLLHDAGGDRSLTVTALPRIIEKLSSLGYKFVSVEQLSGIPRDKLMPRVTGRDTLLVGADQFTFETTYLFQRTLTTLFLLSIWLGVSRVLLFVGLALIQRVREKRRVFPEGFTPSVSVIIAAYNEEKVIARTVQALLDSAYPNLQIIVVDDGSKDLTYQVAKEAFGSDPRVKVLRKPNGGKASALNRGLMAATGEIMVSLDADTLFAPDTIERLVRHFRDPQVGAVSGNVRVGNAHNIFTRWQALEYITSQNFDRRAYDLLNCITVVPGAVGALRRSAVIEVGGYTHDTLAEDTDLTWKLRRAEWRIVNDNTAMAYTEAPETLRNLAKQRFRWAFGTLQCLWKHRSAMFTHGAFGWLALPSLWIYQILFPAISPFMDIGMIWSLLAHNWQQFGGYFLLLLAFETLAAFLALRMDRGNMRLLPWLALQRFVYRQLMYYVVLKSLVSAIRGGAVGWNKFERTGTARIEGKTA
jgi:cellulose synthase/poly-beta-1,6-N-acetylglucosamine synthase-like glycosyltransferase/peptidoglycan/xylan/chitin deacetylase (PgdA/CDA1 family)/spore germination protein YaaH